jgi:Fe-S-cluster containining protein
MKTINFVCINCGDCCRNLLERTPMFGTRGLYLQKNETHLFPAEHLKPMYALSKGKSRPRPGEIFAYQLYLNNCPHLQDNKCSIYSTRPMICRSFPFEAMAASRKCPSISSMIDLYYECDDCWYKEG